MPAGAGEEAISAELQVVGRQAQCLGGAQSGLRGVNIRVQGQELADGFRDEAPSPGLAVGRPDRRLEEIESFVGRQAFEVHAVSVVRRAGQMASERRLSL